MFIFVSASAQSNILFIPLPPCRGKLLPRSLPRRRIFPTARTLLYDLLLSVHPEIKSVFP